MKGIVSFVIIAATLLIGSIFLYQHRPTDHHPAVPDVFHTLTEVRPRKVVQSIMLDGKKVDMEIVVNDTVERLIRETATRTNLGEPNWMDMLRFYVVVGALFGLGIYSLAVFCLWFRDKIKQRAESKDTEDTKRRFDEMIRVCTSVLVTLLTTGGLTPHINEPVSVPAPQYALVTMDVPDADPIIPSNIGPMPAEPPLNLPGDEPK
jgi:hypothetical protein